MKTCLHLQPFCDFQICNSKPLSDSRSGADQLLQGLLCLLLESISAFLVSMSELAVLKSGLMGTHGQPLERFLRSKFYLLLSLQTRLHLLQPVLQIFTHGFSFFSSSL